MLLGIKLGKLVVKNKTVRVPIDFYELGTPLRFHALNKENTTKLLLHLIIYYPKIKCFLGNKPTKKTTKQITKSLLIELRPCTY